MATNDAQVIRLDRYLTQFATRYSLKERVADFIAPPFKVQRPSDRYVRYSSGNLRVYDDTTSRRERAKTIDLELDNDGTYSTQRRKLNVFIDNLDYQNNDNGIRIDEVKTSRLLDAARLARESRIWGIAGSPSIVTQTSTPGTKWDAGGTPVTDILNAMAQVRAGSTMTPNRIVMSMEIALKLIQTDDWKQYFKYTQPGFGDGLFNAVEGLKNLGLDPQIAGAYGLNTAKGTASDPRFETVSGKNVLVFYGEDTPTTVSRVFMYSPFVRNEQIFRWTEQKEDGDYVEVRSDITELLVDANCAFLFTNVIS